MGKRIVWDLDGVLRDLTAGIASHLGGPYDPQAWNEEVLPGVDLCTFIDRHPSILVASPPTEYLPIAGPSPTILTVQPLHWIPWTREWLRRHIPGARVRYCQRMEEKLDLLGPGDLLVEDYPGFSSYDRIVLVDRPYNRGVEARRAKGAGELVGVLP